MKSLLVGERFRQLQETSMAMLSINDRSDVIAFFLLRLAGGETEAGGAHTEREEDLAGHQFPFPCQLRVPLQGRYLFVSFTLESYGTYMSYRYHIAKLDFIRMGPLLLDQNEFELG